MPPLKAFKDHAMIPCSKEIETRRMLVQLDAVKNWSRMSFKPRKSRSLSIRRGKLDEDVGFKIATQDVPRINQEPFKSLGRQYDSPLKDTRRGSEASEQAFVGLQGKEKCGLPGKYRVWCRHLMLIPNLFWPILLYEISSLAVESKRPKIHKKMVSGSSRANRCCNILQSQ
ncbi:reverse transcriptase [Plakobranchus ocellatus]|uniref:Reverse transcriptase n=1 Tax=Plakobranchus ocellatus TaxID=259542 RepID=A0AAV4AHP3_9GAST|nr:reverse transcriptase [Plakobranchus ocellatus]